VFYCAACDATLAEVLTCVLSCRGEQMACALLQICPHIIIGDPCRIMVLLRSLPSGRCAHMKQALVDINGMSVALSHGWQSLNLFPLFGNYLLDYKLYIAILAQAFA
jgi:hypothetical protein